MYCGAAVPEKCVGNGSYFKKKKIWIFFLSFFQNHFPGDVMSLPSPPNIQLHCHSGRNRSMIFLARSLAAVSPTTADWLVCKRHITLGRWTVRHKCAPQSHAMSFYHSDSMFADSLKYVGFSRYRIEYHRPENIRVRYLVTHRWKKKITIVMLYKL